MNRTDTAFDLFSDNPFRWLITIRQIFAEPKINGGNIRQLFIFVFRLYSDIPAEKKVVRAFMADDGDDFVKRIFRFQRYMYLVV